MQQTAKKAVVLLSGGLDSATCLAMAVEQGFDCYCLTVDYGQRHAFEIEAAARLTRQFQARQHKILKVDLRAIGGSALTDDSVAVPKDGISQDIPPTYVPARNTVFLALALGWAEVMAAEAIYIGVNAVDYSGYPDCRPEFIAAFQQLAGLATKAGVEGQAVRICTPLLHLSKAEIIGHAVNAGIALDQVISCYAPDDSGQACGDCDACRIRASAMAEYRQREAASPGT